MAGDVEAAWPEPGRAQASLVTLSCLAGGPGDPPHRISTHPLPRLAGAGLPKTMLAGAQRRLWGWKTEGPGTHAHPRDCRNVLVRGCGLEAASVWKWTDSGERVEQGSSHKSWNCLLPGSEPWLQGGRASPEQWPEPALRGRPGQCCCPEARPSRLWPGLPSSFVDAATCPGSLDCALKRRARCPTGAHACGPCLQPFQEDLQGNCVPRTRRPPGEDLPQPRLEDEIDFLAQELALKEARHSRLTAGPLPEVQQRLLEPAATLGFSERGPGAQPSLPVTRGASLPTPRASLGSPVSSGPVHMAPLETGGGRGSGLALVLMVAFCVAGAAAFAVAALCWCRLQREIRLTQKADYSTAKTPGSPVAPGISGPPKDLDSASDEENEDGDFTVYECPGLAPTGEMEVRNPLFDHASLSAPLPGGHSPSPLQ
ncbi:PREDICTED: neural proliferation differentiation and control protein 1 [Dipodomys ordii]|uniref:Neural proliferation differentiation and control protein 1 n=1 Tax=Dipodomys ordii TaxID=10020 RepID=A0A1S3G9U6_DIPOR|nr:PREDICTED: neural proliferation differentiation and control protein 1 [Dipodomys ordii]